VIEFTNALFRQTFHDLPASRIELTVPKAREADAAGGAVGAWYLDSTNNENDTQALASGVADLLCQNPDLSPGDVAILCRANKTCGEVAQALEDRGVRTSIASGALTSAREVQLLLAALRFLADESDSIALSELVLLSPDSGDNNNDKQLLPSLIEQPEESLEAWRLLPVPAAVSELRSRRARLSPAELLDAAISATGVMEAAESWSRGDLRRANIDRLQKLVDEYEELQTGGNRPATLLGFVKYVEDLESGQAEGDPASGCVVSTYHGAKGLEWPVVIMAELSKHYSTRMFQVSTVSAQAFDAENPLANRQVRYWPWPFGGLKKFDQLDTLLEATPVYQETARIEQAEAQRLLYVGMTRARDQLVLAVRNASKKNYTTPSADWLDVLADQTGAPLIQWPAELGAVSLPVGNYSVAVEIQSLEPDACGPAIIPESSPILRPVVAPLPPETQDLPRWITASGAHGESAGKYTAVELAQIGAPLQISVPKVSRREAEQAETTDLGNAIHTVFGIAHRFATRDRELVLGKIKTVLEEWNVTGVDPQELWRACSSLDSFIEQRYAATAEYREHPVTMRLPNHQELRGWIDLLLETPDGWVIIDHKAYAGDEPEQVAAGYGQQLAWYRTAVEAASGKEFSETLIHFPVLGKVFGVTSGGYRE
jgi:ATP-dependent helicase/nuclease subunit A